MFAQKNRLGTAGFGSKNIKKNHQRTIFGPFWQKQYRRKQICGGGFGKIRKKRGQKTPLAAANKRKAKKLAQSRFGCYSFTTPSGKGTGGQEGQRSSFGRV